MSHISASQILNLRLKRLKFGIWSIIIGLIVYRVSWFQDEGLDVLVFHMYDFLLIKFSDMAVKEYYFIVDRVGAAYVG